MTIPLLILTLISASGLILYIWKWVNQTILNILIGLWAGSMLSVSVVHILPEALEETQYAIYAFMLWFILVYLIEELLTPHAHDHWHGDHSHEDPHEHYNHVALVSWIAIFTHTLFDGVGIRAGMWLSEVIWYAVLIGVAVHQIPVSLSLAAIMKESNIRYSTQLILLGVFALAAPIGYILSSLVLDWVSETVVWLAAALAWWSLLYVATVDLIPVIHGQSRRRIGAVLFFMLWAVWMTLLKLFE